MEGKEIIENITKDEAKLAPRSSAINVGSLRIQLKYPTAGGAGDSSTLDSWAKRELADKSLICEAFNVANKTGLTPSQLQAELEKQKQEFTEVSIQNIESIFKLQSELEKAKELIKMAQNFSARTSKESFERYDEFMKQSTTFLEGSGNKTK